MNIDTALPPNSCAASQTDINPHVAEEGGIFSLALAMECQNLDPQIQSQSIEDPIVTAAVEPRSLPLEAPATETKPERADAEQPDEVTLLPVIPFLELPQPLRQNLPRESRQCVGGKQKLPEASSAVIAMPVMANPDGSAVASEGAKECVAPPAVRLLPIQPGPVHTPVAEASHVWTNVKVIPPAPTSVPIDTAFDTAVGDVISGGANKAPLPGSQTSEKVPAPDSLQRLPVADVADVEATRPRGSAPQFQVQVSTKRQQDQSVPDQSDQTSKPTDQQTGETRAVNRIAPESRLPDSTKSIEPTRLETVRLPDSTKSIEATRLETVRLPDSTKSIEATRLETVRHPDGAKSIEPARSETVRQPDGAKAIEPTRSETVRLPDSAKLIEQTRPETVRQSVLKLTAPDASVPAPAGAGLSQAYGENADQQSERGKETSRDVAISRRSAEDPKESQVDRIVRNTAAENHVPVDPGRSVSTHEAAGSSRPESAAVADAPKATPSDAWTHIDKSSVISQLVEKARLFQWEKNSEIVISLRPETLGHISLRASIVDQTLVATIVAESEKVKNLIELELPALHRTLQENGMPAKVVVVQGGELNFGNAGSHGQPTFHQNSTSREPGDGPSLWRPGVDKGNELVMESLVVADDRYRSRSIHLIA